VVYLFVATTTIIPLHAGKGRPVATALKISADYIKNPEKTDGGEWVTSYQCDPLIVDDEFMFSKNQYAAITGRDQGARDVIAYHLRVSFKPGETDAETANKIGYDLAMKLCHGNHAFVCCTHTDRAHLHSHIVINSTSLDCTRKFRNFKGSAFAIRHIADHLCVENGLSIIADPKPSRGHYGKWQGDSKPQTNREKLEHMINDAIENAKDYDGFIAAMIEAGCEVKQGAHLAFKIPGADRFARCKSLGEDYTEEAVRERLMGLRKVARSRTGDGVPDVTFVPFVITGRTKFSLLIDIQKKVQEGKGEAYEQWAKIYNLKQAARTLIYLKENGIDSYDELVKKSSSASGEFSSRTKRIREIEERQKEISELQKQIGTYRKTRETYRRYLTTGRDQAFRDAEATDIILHEAAKRHFDGLGYGKKKKLPTIDALKQEWATLQSEKKSLYNGYRELKDQRTELLNARGNCERLLGINRDAPENTAGRDQKRNQSHDR